MYLNASLLFEELQKVFPVTRTGPVLHDEHLHPPLLYRPGMEMRPDQIYVGRGADFDPQVIPPERSCIVCIGPPPERYLRSRAACLVVEEPLEVGALLNQLQDIFEVFRRWELRLEAMIQDNAGIQEILNESQPLFPGNFFLLLDVNYRVMATTSEHNYVMDQSGCTPSSVLTRFKKDPEYARMRYHREIFLYRGLYFDHGILTHHIFLNDELCGTFTLTEKEAGITDGRWTLFGRLARLVDHYYQQRFYLLHSTALRPAAVFSQLLKGEIVSKKDLSQSLKSVGWNVEDEYVVCFISVHESDKKIHSASYLCQQLEAILIYALALEYQTDIAVIMNTTKIASKAGQSQETFRAFLSEGMLQAGVSRPFHDMMQLKNYYQQARAAVTVGSGLEPGRPVYRFEALLLPYMLSNLSGGIEAETLCPRGLLEMREQDRKRGSAYLQTLDTYFRTGCNATQAARELYINRSTFLERMARIWKFLNVDQEDYDTRLYLMLCLRLLRP